MATEAPFETMTDQEKQTAFTAICYWHGTDSTNSVYVLNCNSSIEAERKAHGYFLDKRGVMFPHIRRIEILPRGKGRWDKAEPVFWKNYPFPIS